LVKDVELSKDQTPIQSKPTHVLNYRTYSNHDEDEHTTQIFNQIAGYIKEKHDQTDINNLKIKMYRKEVNSAYDKVRTE